MQILEGDEHASVASGGLGWHGNVAQLSERERILFAHARHCIAASLVSQPSHLTA
ncbi:MAG: hypothetical protein HYZ45_08470 [Burkholderiales bacterium]|nr:hypothetical protein [Burkholderiales bacterium]